MNNATFAGNVGADCRINQVGENSVCNFVLAVRDRKKGADGKNLTIWVDCALWGKRADVMSGFLTKGTKVSVSGSVNVETYEKDGQTNAKLTLNVNDVTLQGSNGASTGGFQQQQKPAPQQAPAMSPPDFDDDLPF